MLHPEKNRDAGSVPGVAQRDEKGSGNSSAALEEDEEDGEDEEEGFWWHLWQRQEVVASELPPRPTTGVRGSEGSEVTVHSCSHGPSGTVRT